MTQLLTSSQVAKLLGVAPSSVKRWTQSGLLPCETTPGKHRRFTREQVENFARFHRELRRGEPVHEATAWTDLLLKVESSYELQSVLLAERGRQSSWHAVADHMGLVLEELGARWARGEISVLDEHRASERLARALAWCAESIPVSHEASIAFLATPEGEEHTLPLNLAELCLREAGWNVIWGGRSLPTPEIVRAIESHKLELVGLTASKSCADVKALSDQARLLGAACARTGAHLVLGGSGAWPEMPEYAEHVHRLRSFGGFHEFLLSSAD